MSRISAVVVLVAAVVGQNHFDPFAGSDCDCDRYCRYECAINATQAPIKTHIYRMTMQGVYDLSDKDSGDEGGDTSFVLAKKNNAYYCRTHPKDFLCLNLAQFSGDDANSTDLIMKMAIEVDGQWGPYLECNPSNASDNLGKWSCENGLSPAPPPDFPKQCKTIEYFSFNGYCVMQDPDATVQGSLGDCCDFIGNASAGAYGAYNYYPSNSTCLLFKEYLHGHAEPCDTSVSFAQYSPPDPNKCECERIYKTVGRQNQTSSGGQFAVAGGLWYSHPSGGECSPDQNVGDGSGCTYKVLDIPRVINATCMYKTIDAAVEALNPACFGLCHKPFNVTSDCYLQCYSVTTKAVKDDKSKLVAPWIAGFADDGCPQVEYEAAEARKSHGLL